MNRYKAQSLASIADVDRSQWDRIFGDACEGYDYYLACEQAEPSQFEFSAIGVFDGDRLVAGAPIFRTGFRLDMLLEGRARSVGNWLHARRPSALAVPVIGAGHPHADELGLALEPELTPAEREEAVSALLEGLDAAAMANGDKVMVLKNVNDRERAWSDDILRRYGYSCAGALPIATLAIPRSTDAYIAGLSQNMRSNLRRKLKKASRVRVDIRNSAEGVEEEIFDLRESTRAKAVTDYDQFAEIAPGYFREVMGRMGQRAKLLLYSLDNRLIGFALVLLEPKLLKEKYNGMCYPEGPDNGVFYLNWMTQVRLCIEHGIPTMHAGETTYLIKSRLGCKLHRSWIYYRHRSPVLNRVFKASSRWVAFDTSDPDLKRLGADAPYAATE
jgi:hypothetical protein